MAAQWSDDFQFAIHAFATGERNGRLQDFGELARLARLVEGSYGVCQDCESEIGEERLEIQPFANVLYRVRVRGCTLEGCSPHPEGTLVTTSSSLSAADLGGLLPADPTRAARGSSAPPRRLDSRAPHSTA
jgi:hypothetical protein